MSGLISGIDYNLLFAPDSTANASTAILKALFTSTPSSSSSFASTGDPLLDLRLAQKDEAVDVAQQAKQPMVQQAIAAFTTAVSHAKDIKTALGNPNVQKVLLTASGLSNYIGETGLVQKAFMSDLSDPKSLANKLGDSALLSTVQTYNFAKNGLAELQNPQILATLTNGYAEVTWRQSLDKATPGLSNALDILSQATSIRSFGDILARPSNFYVITGALGIPPNIVFQSLSAQQTAINSRVDYAKFQDPAYVTSLADQYLLSQRENSQSNASTSPDLTTLAVQSSGLLV
jgi:hypothetical protein